MSELTQTRLKELLDYSPIDGLFVWRVPKGGKAVIGRLAGSVDYRGYVRIKIDYKSHMAHRLAFLFMEGSFPPDLVDHRDRCRTNNRWENLRHADASLNSRNMPVRTASGHMGVSWNKGCGMWRASIKIDRVSHHLGYFARVEDAAAAYAAALRELEGERK
jgi:hypothetical protein